MNFLTAHFCCKHTITQKIMAGLAILASLIVFTLLIRNSSMLAASHAKSIAPLVPIIPDTIADTKGAKAPEVTPQMLVLGKEIYAKQCSSCHGPEGKGDGTAAYILLPKPRNLTSKSFRLTSNLEGKVAVEDIFQTITRGMPGSAMPSWEILSEEDRWAVSHYIKSLGRPDMKPATPMEIVQEPPMSTESVAHGRQLFLQSCVACHGVDAHGDGTQEQFDTDGYPTRPRDLTFGIFKGGRESTNLYHRLAAGMPGSPMPSNLSTMKPADIWDLVHYVQGLSDSSAQSRNQNILKTVVAKPCTGAPLDDPKDPRWQQVDTTYLALMPLWWRNNRTEGVSVRATHDGTNLYICISWEDQTANSEQLVSQSFRDGVAVQLTGDAEPPFLGMGQKDASDVRIWYWKADRQKDAAGRQDVQNAHPEMYVATYPCDKKDPAASEKMGVDYGGQSDAKSLDVTRFDPKFITGLGAGNLVSSVNNSCAESLSAQGFGTLGTRPSNDRGVSASGDWEKSIYRVVFKRPLIQEGNAALNLVEGKSYFIAFACWDGNAGDRNGQKNVTIWHRFQVKK